MAWKRRLRNRKKSNKKNFNYPRNVEQKNKIWKAEWKSIQTPIMNNAIENIS